MINQGRLLLVEKATCMCLKQIGVTWMEGNTVVPAKSDSAIMFCLQSYQGLVQ